MGYTFYQLVWLFFLYSFAGWCAEVALAVIQRRKFVNRGFVSAPFCPIYGTGAVLFAVFLTDMKGHGAGSVLFIYIFGCLLAALVELFTGALLEKFFHRKWWDYSKERFNFDGYVCLKFAMLWGAFALLLVYAGNALLSGVISLLPEFLMILGAWVLIGVLVLDSIGTALAIRGMQKKLQSVSGFTENMKEVSRLLENSITRYIQRRMEKAFPNLDRKELVRARAAARAEKEKKGIFAAGCSFYKIVYLFFIAAFLGDLVETIWCYFMMGRLMSRSSVVYGQFSIVWGLGCAGLTWTLYRYRTKSDSYLFTAGALLGGLFEYICSVVTELVFGTIFWDYSSYAFNLGGRINLLFCFFWGIVAVVWFRAVYPIVSKAIEKIPAKPGKVIAWCLIVFLCFDAVISSLAMERYSVRNSVITAESASQSTGFLDRWLDLHFPDERMKKIYPGAKIVANMDKK